MGCQEVIKVDSLHEKEAWELFNKSLKRHRALTSNEEEIAKDVVKECAGLPLAIVTTARSLSVVYDIKGWRNALNELRDLVKGLTVDIENDVFKILEFSYHRLNNDKIRECLLYCALFPEDYVIPKMSLIRYWIAEGLIEEMESMQAERDRGHAVLNKLENASLLERCKGGDAVKMHDVIRDMAINIARKDSRVLVKTGRNLGDLSSETLWPSNLERVSFFNSELPSLMFVPKCPNLSTMFLQWTMYLQYGYRRLVHVPKSFFMHTVGLKVLDLSDRSLAVLPESVYDLVNLRALILRGCKGLKHVGSLEKLKELRMLDFRVTEIETIPNGIEKLIRLKEFYWTYRTSEDKFVYLENKGQLADFDRLPKLLSNLFQLQCLCLLDKRVRDLEAEELSKLTKLEILITKFSSLHNFNSYISTQHYRSLTHYDVQLVEKIFVLRSQIEVELYRKKVNVVGYSLKEGTEDNYEDQLVLPIDLQALHLKKCLAASLWDVSPSLKKMMDLEECRIEDCYQMKYLCRVEDWIASLNILYLEGLTSLRALFKLERTDIGRSCNWNLKHLKVRDCHNLKHLFAAGLVNHHLQNLVTIIVTYCNQMEEIIAPAGEEEEEILSLPNLQRLELYSLPKLKSIWKGTMTCDSLQQLEVINCPELKRLPISVHVSGGDGETRASGPPLQEIVGQEEWWERVEWDTHPAAKSLFQPLFQLPS